MRVAILSCLLLTACLPTSSKVVTCTTNAECGDGFRCDLTRNVCVCSGTSFSGCENFIDGGLNADGPADAPVSPTDITTPVDSGTEAVDSSTEIVDAPPDLPGPDTRVPDAAGTCGVASDCTDPTKAFCVAGVCVGCQPGLDGGVGMCAAPTGVCDTTSGRCVGCTASSQCTSAAPDSGARYLVVVVDEYADLGLTLGKTERAEFERQILRLAQRGRAAGIFLILATQRPSVDFITGAVKANFSTRVSFRLAQRVDSQVILDEPGAEDLLGAGDLLLLHEARLQRLQGYFASTEEITKLIDDRITKSRKNDEAQH